MSKFISELDAICIYRLRLQPILYAALPPPRYTLTLRQYAASPLDFMHPPTLDTRVHNISRVPRGALSCGIFHSRLVSIFIDDSHPLVLYKRLNYIIISYYIMACYYYTTGKNLIYENFQSLYGGARDNIMT